MKGKFTTALQLLREGKNEDKDVIDFLLSCSTTLKEIGDSVQLEMPKFSEYRRSGKVWHSPPFYYREGYKMCLAVYANGTGEGAGTHVSVSLLLLKGKYDDQLKWPMKFCEGDSAIEHLYQDNKISYSMIHDDGSKMFSVCSEGYCQVTNELEHKQLGHCDRFCGLRNMDVCLVNDCLTLTVKYRDSCHLMVLIA